ncbi:MAG TPA: hypothetical protein PKE51_01155 [Gemmatimonadaceae bacterium]|jgi:hypothetical protein|nr:hypothetical protein [Gemmatimonadaceae bacterium]
MPRLTVAQYDLLERAIDRGDRIVVERRRHEYVVIPERLGFDGGREQLITRHPTTGDRMVFQLDELDSLQAVS